MKTLPENEVTDAILAQAEALEYRARGLTYAEIAKVQGLKSPQAAWERVKAGLKRTVREASEHTRQFEVRRLDILLRPHLKKAAAGEDRATELVLKIMDRRARLLGLDAPTKIAPTNPEGDLSYDRPIDAGEARRIVAALASLDSREIATTDPAGAMASATEAAGGDTESGI